MKETDPLFVTALARGLEILRCFTPARGELGTTEIARLTGLPQPTVWRLCKTLAALGYLVPTANDKLRVGAAALLLGYAVVAQTGINDYAVPLMKAAADALGTTVLLAERHEASMVVIQRCEPAQVRRVMLHIGSTVGLTDSSLGLAYLAAQPPAERERIVAGLQAEGRWDADGAPGRLRTALDDYARHGAVFMRYPQENFTAIGVPVQPADRHRTLVLTCGASDALFTDTHVAATVAPALKRLAAEIAPLLIKR
ncbi:IclR family transcriptional regulator [Pigmentiphaga kullae]|uniref:IclR family transcriptional regulator n=1 Tax=Pigmentiphaga kullae TaxID=151784 RepID=A0A4Q7NDT5_9BURK|nr:helix-turn-helix domain-containing protein [Pigmentiphaga kullae]RZS81120.1 IclR family transcriptional regulator [Pigmentiphaga kullae]